jgi:hypothetical protein
MKRASAPWDLARLSRFRRVPFELYGSLEVWTCVWTLDHTTPERTFVTLFRARRRRKPLLFLDVDGVISLFGFRKATDWRPGCAVRGPARRPALDQRRDRTTYPRPVQAIWSACESASSWSGRPAGRRPPTTTSRTCSASRAPPLPELRWARPRGPAHWKIERDRPTPGDARSPGSTTTSTSPAAWAERAPGPTADHRDRRHEGMCDEHVRSLMGETAAGRPRPPPPLEIVIRPKPSLAAAPGRPLARSKSAPKCRRSRPRCPTTRPSRPSASRPTRRPAAPRRGIPSSAVRRLDRAPVGSISSVR